MRKSTEQGNVWEWRAFGVLDGDLVRTVESHPIRMGVHNTREQDLYFVSATSNQNIKLRRTGDDWVLKLKLLLKTRDAADLYLETPEMVYGFPVRSTLADEVASLLDAVLPSQERDMASNLDRDQFVRLMAQSSPPIDLTPVLKTRSQFEFNEGWVEIASAVFPLLSVQSIAVQSLERQAVERIKEEIRIRPNGLGSMNYVQACRRWK